MTNLTIGDDLLASLSVTSREQLRTYRDLILHWNQRFNLTALESEEAVDQRLIGDALRLLPTIDVVLTRRPDGRRLVDLGTGAGLPGVAIKIVESMRRRSSRRAHGPTASGGGLWFTAMDERHRRRPEP